MHFAGVCEPSSSHLMFMAAIGRALMRRGHRFTLFQPANMAVWAEREDVSLHDLDPYWRATSPPQPMGSLGQSMRYFCETLPNALTEVGIQCVLTDQLIPAGGSAAEAIGLPFVTLCIAAPMNGEPAIPPNFVPWSYRATPLGRLRNRAAYSIRDLFLLPANIVLNRYRRRWRLPSYRRPEDSFSRLAQITQIIAEFDFPRSELPDCFHYVGPYERHKQNAVAFPFDQLDGRPLIYLAFGTQIGEKQNVWRAVAEACVALDVQLVLSKGNLDDVAAESPQLPGNPIVVRFAPQSDLLKRTAVFVTHGGLNSTLEALTNGVPMAAVPFDGDTPGITSRIVFHGVGQALPRKSSPQAWRRALAQILEDPTYRQQAQRFARLIQQTRGAEQAAEIVEQAATTGRPVTT